MGCLGALPHTALLNEEFSEAAASLWRWRFATSKIKAAGPQKGRRVVVRSEEGEKSIAVGIIRRTFSLAAISAQSHLLLGRLEGLGRGDSSNGEEV